MARREWQSDRRGAAQGSSMIDPFIPDAGVVQA
jgi:hypothetical protein